MTEITIYKKRLKVVNWRLLCCWFLAMLCGILIFTGCVTVKPQQQRLVSKPNMQFDGSVIFNYNDKLLTQTESGSASFTGGQSGSCGSCVAGGSQ